MRAVGLDIGGTKIAAAIVNETGQFEHRLEVATDTSSAEALFEQVCELLDNLLSTSNISLDDIHAIGIGVPGKVDSKMGIAVYQNNIPWAQFPVVERMKERYGDIVVTIDNDVKVAAYAEYHQRTIPEDEVFTYLTISTGIASATLINHEPIRGKGFTGEVGFFPVYNGEGNQVTLEPYASGQGFAEAIRQAYQDTTLNASDVFTRSRQGDEVAQMMIEERAQAIAQVLYAHVVILDPTMIVLGGSVATHNPDFVDSIRQKLAEYTMSEQEHILNNIYVSELGSSNGLMGAGLYALQQLV